MSKHNPFKTKINYNTYILGYYRNTDSKGEYTYFAVLISIKNGNRYIEPITISKKEWHGMCTEDAKTCKKIIKRITGCPPPIHE